MSNSDDEARLSRSGKFQVRLPGKWQAGSKTRKGFSRTNQIRIQQEAAQAAGKRHEIVTGEATKVSGPVKRAATSSDDITWVLSRLQNHLRQTAEQNDAKRGIGAIDE